MGRKLECLYDAQTVALDMAMGKKKKKKKKKEEEEGEERGGEEEEDVGEE